MPRPNMDKSRITLTIDRELRDRLQLQADASGRSLSNLVNYLLKHIDTRPRGEVEK